MNLGGYDDERRKVGRPMINNGKGSNVFTGKCDVRLTAEEDNALSRLAERNGATRSEIMRKALRDFAKWCEEE